MKFAILLGLIALIRLTVADLPVLSVSELDVSDPSSRGSARTQCQTLKVTFGDSCVSLASKCNISTSDSMKYNPNENLCSTLADGQQVCCSTGGLSDIETLPGPYAACTSYKIKTGDTCMSIANGHNINVEDISKFNDNSTLGWLGCDKLIPGLVICLSEGTPLGGIGCTSNCDMDIVKDVDKPESFFRIGYYESWNFDRPCLNLRPDNIESGNYTHIHWSFATITTDWDISINDTYELFPLFTSLSNVKRVVVVGGWGLSTDPSIYNNLRDALDPSNAPSFVNNIVDFSENHNLDGIEINWEYPGAPNMPGIPAGLPTDAPNYLEFLKLLRAKLTGGKSLSIVAPASYWFLKAFPLGEMSKLVDYIVLASYDLHGQWDYNNHWSQSGCVAGNCLRSHVNLTETLYALALIIDAGVPTNKVIVGVSSYGRAFGMTQPYCTAPMCTFEGPESTASPGECTLTPGYLSNAEIYDIIAMNVDIADGAESNLTEWNAETYAQTWYDSDSDSDILIYNGNQWVSFMSPTTKASRISYYQTFNYGGVADWAIDLEFFAGDQGDPRVDNDGDEDLPPTQLTTCDAQYESMEELDAALDSIDPYCQVIYMVATLSNVLQNATDQYDTMMKNGYDKKFSVYAKSVAASASTTVRGFMNKNGNNYFACIVTELSMCCHDCQISNSNDQCRYCFNGKCNKKRQADSDISIRQYSPPSLTRRNSWNQSVGSADPPPGGLGGQQNKDIRWLNVTEPCPPDYSKRGYGPDNPYEQTVYWALNNDKADQFYADLFTDTGIAKDKVQFATVDRGNDCPPSAHADDDCWGVGMDFGIPTPKGYDEDDVANPKDVVQQALENSNNLVGQLSSLASDLRDDCYIGDPWDLIDSVSIPVLMIAQAVDSMALVEETADKIEEEKRKAIILAFIGALLFFLPIAGEVIGAATEIASIATILSILSAAGTVAMDIYTIVKDPQNAPLAIIDLILAPLALEDIGIITQAANIRRGMSDADIAKLGGEIAKRMQTIQKVTGVCRKH